MAYLVSRSALPHTTKKLEKPVVRAVVAVTGATAIALAMVWLATGRSVFLAQATASLFTCTIGLTQIVMKRENTYTLVVLGATGLAVNVAATGTIDTRASSTASLVVIGIGATLFSTRPRAHVILYGIFLFIAMFAWHDGALPAGVIEGAITAMVFAFGATVIEWIRRQADATSLGYEHLFRSAPVSIWREDFRQVQTWLEWLRTTGVKDLRAYLEEDPARIDQAAELIELREVNQAAIDLLEASDAGQLIGSLDSATMTEETRSSLIDQLVAVWEGQDHIVTEVRRGRTLRGNPLEGLLSFAAPSVNGTPDYSQVIVAIVDVTQSRQAQAKLEELVTSKDELIAAVSHELRTPLTAVVGLSGELVDNYEMFSADEAVEFIRLIANQSEDVSLIVEDLLVAAQAESGTIQVQPEPTDVHEQVEMALEGMRSGAAIPVELPAPIDRAFVDPGRVRQIIRNLLTNATRYGEQPIRVVVRSEADTVMVEVRDSGHPLPTEQREEIFERYHRAKERPGVAASVGVGLTVSRELARAMGGDLVYDHDGETVFRLSLPTWTGQTQLVAV